MKKLFILGTILVSTLSYSQIGIGTGNPHATLEIAASGDNNTADGIIIPKLTRAQLTNKGNSLYTADQLGTMIYITDVSGGDAILSRINILTSGFYFFDGSLWQKVNEAAYTGSNSIVLDGNSIQRSALTGDITADVDSNLTTITNNAVTTPKIFNGSVTDVKLANNSVNSSKIIDGTIATVDLANNSVNSAKIINGTIIAEDLASNSVTPVKIQRGSTGSILTSTGTGVAWQDPTFVSRVGAMKSVGTLSMGYFDVSTGSLTLTPGTWMVSAKYSTKNSVNSTYFTWLYMINTSTGQIIDSVGTVPETEGQRYATPYLQIMIVVTSNLNIKIVGTNSCNCASITTDRGAGHFFAYKIN